MDKIRQYKWEIVIALAIMALLSLAPDAKRSKCPWEDMGWKCEQETPP